MAEAVDYPLRRLLRVSSMEPAYRPSTALVYGSLFQAARWAYQRRFGPRAGQPVPWCETLSHLYKLGVS